ncbi:helix-turn-helix domain-containing protein [Legionella resiliens]|uniref:Helix-turn-helix domain-containing protein n=1 Tax=Legionella resiliens TaxID=2905958 RepID=A0ABS8XA57_9GAMM|nr:MULTISPECIES: helix-turn-helix domain-containing protein [unclassified Legionella]MCE0723991.1 helix-turn-helix domain-containing protein [Legionella sp. 9fVS26]MCE3533144.1 helix-turn-helix domain-containing protein [Legionella sp. 8cVS16]
MIKKNSPAKQLGNPKSKKSLYGNSASTKRKRLLSYLEKNHRLSIIESREKLGILHLGARFMELRRKGYKIETHWIKEPDSNGVLHCVRLYVHKGCKEIAHEK